MTLEATEAFLGPQRSSQVRVSIQALWKVFGSGDDPDVLQRIAGLSRAEVQATYNCVVALQDVNFDVYDGETFVVMGLSGSGKSTLVRCINRLIRPTTGSVLVDGDDVMGYDDEELTAFRRTKTSMVFQQFGLLPHRTVLENTAWGLEIQNVSLEERSERAQEVLELVGLGEWGEYRPFALSGGMQQRVGLARALASDPEILLMDEPFSALDPLIRRDMQDELMRLQGQMQKTTIFITHDLSEAVRLGNRIAIMRDGTIIQLGTPEEIVAEPVDEYVADFTRDVRTSTVVTVGYIMDRYGTKEAPAEINRPNANVASEQTVDEALSQRWSTPGQLPVMDESGTLVGVIDRDALLQAAFEQPGLSNDNHEMTLAPADVSPTKAVGVAKPLALDEAKPTVDQSLARHISANFGRLVYAPALLGILAMVVCTAVVTIIWGQGVSFPVNWGPDIATWVNDSLRWLTRTGAPVFDSASDAVLSFLVFLENALRWFPWPTVVLGIALLSWRTVSWKFGLFAVGTLVTMGMVGLWGSALETIALIVVAAAFSVVIAIPLGILAARNNTVDSAVRPILDAMQTMPPFVYLVPGIMLFGIGNVPGIFATVIYAVPPAIRLTNLGIRQVTPQVVEAAQSFGTTRRQLLQKVQLPMAIPTIMAGINQTIMMALGMVVVASLVGAGGLGEDVLRALGRFRPGEALLAGLAIVALAIILDRITQAWARNRQASLGKRD